jgi:hypothetical protein
MHSKCKEDENIFLRRNGKNDDDDMHSKCIEDETLGLGITLIVHVIKKEICM